MEACEIPSGVHERLMLALEKKIAAQAAAPKV
jgi:hypothetical protein